MDAASTSQVGTECLTQNLYIELDLKLYGAVSDVCMVGDDIRDDVIGAQKAGFMV